MWHFKNNGYGSIPFLANQSLYQITGPVTEMHWEDAALCCGQKIVKKNHVSILDAPMAKLQT